MGTVGAAPTGQPAQNVREFLRRRPESGAAAVVAVAWAVLAALAVGGARLGSPSGMPGMSTWSEAVRTLPFWVLMTIAMMGPAALAGIRHTAVNSLRWRRRRAMAEFSAAYLLVWTGFGFLALAAASRLSPAGHAFGLSAVLAAAAAWELTSVKRRTLRGCHRSAPLPPRGWRAEAAAFRFGLRNGGACLGSCWCLMLVMAVAPAHQLLWTIALTGIVTTEKLRQRPRATTQAAAALAIAALVVLTTATASRW